MKPQIFPSFYPRFQLGLFLIAILFLSFSSLSAQELTKEEIQQKLEELKKQKQEEELVQKQTAAYTQALDLLKQKEEYEAKPALFEKEQKEIAEKLPSLKEQVSKLPKELEKPTLPTEATTESLLKQKQEIETKLKELQKQLIEPKKILKDARLRKEGIPALVEEAKKHQEETTKKLNAPADPKEPQEMGIANKRLWLATQINLKTKLVALEKELPLLKLRIEYKEAETTLLQHQLKKESLLLQILYETLHSRLQKPIAQKKEALQAEQKKVEQAKEEVKKQLNASFQKAEEALKKAEDFLNKKIELEKEIIAAPELLEKANKTLDLLAVNLDLSKETSIPQLEQLFTETKTGITLSQNELSKLEDTEKKRIERLKAIETAVPELKKKREALEKEQAKAFLPETPEEVKKAQQFLLEMQLFALTYEEKALQAEQIAYQELEELLKTQQEAQKKKIAQGEKQLAEIQEALKSKKKEQVTTQLVSIAQIDEAIKQLEGKEMEKKDKIIEIYNEAKKNINKGEEALKEAEEFDRERLEAPSKLEKLKAEKEKFTPFKEPKVELAKIPLTELRTQLSILKRELQNSQDRLTKFEAEEVARGKSQETIPAEIQSNKDGLEKATKDLEKLANSSEGSELAQAKRLELQTRQALLRNSIKASEKKLLKYEAVPEIISNQIFIAKQQESYFKKAVQYYEQTFNEKKQYEAKQEAIEAQEAIKKMAEEAPVVLPLAKKVAALANESTKIVNQNATIVQRQQYVEKELLALQDKKKWVHDISKIKSQRNNIGLVLRTQREQLLDIRGFRRQNEARQSEISKVQIRLINLKREQDELTDLESQKENLVKQLDKKLTEKEKEAIAKKIEELLTKQSEHLRGLSNEYDTYSAKIFQLDAKEKELIGETVEFAKFLDENILWVRSSTTLSFSHFAKITSGLSWFTNGSEWTKIKNVLLKDFKENPLLGALAIIVFILLAISRKKLIHQLQKIGGEIGTLAAQSQGEKNPLLLTFNTFLLTILIALVVPLLTWLIAWRLTALFQDGDLGHALGIGLATLSSYFFIFEFTRQFCTTKGLGESHFRWSIRSLKTIRNEITWFMWISIPAFFVVATMEWQQNDELRQSVGRLAFILGLIALAVFIQRLLNPSRDLLSPYLKRNKGKIFDRTRYFWYPALVGIPILLATLAFVGYYYTAHKLEQKLHSTLGWFLALLTLHSFIVRWFDLARLKLVLEEAQRKKEEAQRKKEEEKLKEEGGEQAPNTEFTDLSSEATDKKVDLSAITKQTQKLANALVAVLLILGLWWIWIDVFPALNILSQIELVDDVFETTETISEGDGKTIQRKGFKPLTLADVILSLLVFTLTIIASKNIRGVLEITILQKLPIDEGGKYAFTTISQYVVTAVGIICACALVGFTWSRLEWIIAFMSLGLSFGLQEIFANFFSGLILLFERPIRIGDIVTIGDKSGTVSRIQIRATTIIDWDRKEIFIPNKKLITDNITNWSHSNTVLRVVIPVGVAYGSDTKRVEEVLMDIVKTSPLVVNDPAPSVLFMNFGNNTLDFELRFFIQNCSSALSTRHAINNEIDQRFREEDIEISFPQRDLHIRSVDSPLPIQLTNATTNHQATIADEKKIEVKEGAKEEVKEAKKSSKKSTSSGKGKKSNKEKK